MEVRALVMFAVLFLLLLIGFPVAFTLGAVALGFGSIFLGLDFFNLLPLRIWAIMTNFTLLAVPLFVFMGVILEKSGIAEELLEPMGQLFGRIRGGLAISVVAVGALLAATTGVEDIHALALFKMLINISFYFQAASRILRKVFPLCKGMNGVGFWLDFHLIPRQNHTIGCTAGRDPDFPVVL